jgi:hypothetical protein
VEKVGLGVGIVSIIIVRVPRPSSAWAGIFLTCKLRRKKYSGSFSLPHCRLRFNLDRSFLAVCVVSETAPEPIFRPRHQPAMDGITVDTAQFLDELALTPDVEIAIALLPERFLRAQRKPPRDALLQGLHRLRERSTLRLIQQQMDMFRHDDVPVDAEPVRFPDTLERG